jgi:uncharacterized protein YbjT (DUF2867 family)
MILVIGSTGKIGSELVRQLSAKGTQVRALVRDLQKGSALEAPGVEIFGGDLGDPASLDAAHRGVDRVFLLSGVDQRQVELQGNAVKAAQRAGARHIVKLGAAGTSLDSPINVARAHAQTEKDIEESGIPYTFLRPTLFMQFVMMHAPTIRADGAVYAPMRDGKVPMVDVRDIAAVAATVLTSPDHEGQAYTLTGPEALSMSEVARKLTTAVGKPVKYVDVPPDAARRAMVAQGIPPWFVEDLLKLMEFFAAGYAATVSPDAKSITGQARTFDAFARDFAQAFKA